MSANLKCYSALILLSVLIACGTKDKKVHVNSKVHTKMFTVEVRSIKTDTVTNVAIFHNDYLFCLQSGNKLIVLDSNLNTVKILSTKLSLLKPLYVLKINDTLIIVSEKGRFYLNSNFEPKRYVGKYFNSDTGDYSDSAYVVTSCSVGEFGGAVFFKDKKTNKTYSYPAICVQQVQKFQDNYVVSNYLSHMGGFTDYLFIKDPKMLYELDTKKNNYCNWYIEDTTLGVKMDYSRLPSGVKYFENKFRSKTLVTFPFNNELYSIYSTDSATILAKFQNYKLVTVDTLLKHELYFYNVATTFFEQGSISAYQARWARSGEGNSMREFQNSGLLCIKGNRISIIEFLTPHMK